MADAAGLSVEYRANRQLRMAVAFISLLAAPGAAQLNAGQTAECLLIIRE
jgi:hypothetical protein